MSRLQGVDDRPGVDDLPGRTADLDVAERRDAVVVHLLTDAAGEVTQHLREVLERAVDRSRYVVVDLAKAGTLDSTGLAVLVRAHQRAKRRDGVLAISAPSLYVMTVLYTMRLHRIFPMFEDCASALAWQEHTAVPISRPPSVRN